MKYVGCKDICDIYSPLYYNGFCQSYPVQTIASNYILSKPFHSENLKWSIIYDPLHIDVSPKVNYEYYYFYGIFRFNSGIYRFFYQLSTYSYSTYLIGFKITIALFGDIPLNCGIQFKINNTYQASIYRNDQGIQTHRLKIYKVTTYEDSNYTSNQKYDLITYLDIPKSPFLFSAVGNYTDDTAGWGMVSIEFTSGYCCKYCKLCEVPFKCISCINGFYLYRDGTCINGCSQPYQKLNGSYCYDYDDETPYSKYLIQEYINSATDPGQYSQYTIISQTGLNFLKGLDIYYSYWQGYRVFGGPFVWAQAQFQRIHNIIDPHHSITIAFYILYGPQFPSDGIFKYTIENNSQVSKSTASVFLSYADGTKIDKVYEKIIHNSNTLTITWECFGQNNEPIYAYCGFFNYYIAVHYCQPYCLKCSDQNTCEIWNSTYDSTIVKFSQDECLSYQYFDKDTFRCLQCPLTCLTCTSKIDCQLCQPTYTQTKQGCVCLLDQYENLNQCLNCPNECNQCLSSTYCVECLIQNNRQLKNGECKCRDGYYPIEEDPQCQLCHQYCKTCFGPTSSDCLTCSAIARIEQIESTCKCPTKTYYSDALQKCSDCYYSCQTCFSSTIDGCLSCDPSQNRILKGLICECASGYYDVLNICTECPTALDTNQNQCYKQCNNNQIWHTITCDTCASGFELKVGQCYPICGDLQITGYEQCDDNNTNLCFNCQFKCPIHCQTCDSTTTLPCPDYCGDGIISGNEECEDGNNIQYDGCFDCKFQCQLECTKCIKGECFECATNGWYIDPTVSPWICKERCGDLIIIGNEQCDDANSNDTDGCKDCKYFCRIGCSSCDYNTNTCLSCEFPGFVPYSYYCKNDCGDGLVVNHYGFFEEQCDDGNTINYDGCSSSCQFQCQPTTICINCIDNRCVKCDFGYFLTSDQICKQISQSSCLISSTIRFGCDTCKHGYRKVDQQCYSICGDKYVTDDEQCDDGNLVYGDGCHFCQFSCQDSCLNCIKGTCYDCQDNYELIQSQCYPKCGDGIIVPFLNEECNIQNQLCINCQFNCYPYCLKCDLQCLRCENGFKVDFNYSNQCIPICGDGIVIDDFEDCDDQNDEPFDGCFECKFQCQQNCQECLDGICLQEYCPSGTIWINNSCLKLCIDNCNICEEEQCISCISNYQLIDNQCILQNYTENNQMNEGKNRIQIYDNQLCRQSECVLSKSPQMSLLYLNQTFSMQYVQINFDQQISLLNPQEKSEQMFKISILHLNEKHYVLTLYPIQDLTLDLQFVQYEIAIEFLISLETQPILQVQLNHQAINSNYQQIHDYNQSIQLLNPKFISEQFKQSSVKMQKSNKGLMIGAISISVICLLSGEGSIFVETLNFLQYQSFLRFINVDYPENLYIYYKAQELLTIEQYIEFLDIQEYLKYITFQEKSIQPNGKFQLYNLDADFVSQILPQIFQSLTFIILLLMSKKLYLLFQKSLVLILNTFPQFFENKQSKFAQIILNQIHRINKKLKFCIHWFFSLSLNTIRTFFYFNSWDVLFKAILFLKNFRNRDIRALISIILSGLVSGSYIYFTLYTFYQYIPKKQNNDKFKQQLKLMAFELCRTIQFHIFIIVFQDEPILQCVFLSMNNILQCIIIYKYKCCHKLEKIILIVNEGLLSIYTFTQLLYLKIAYFDLSQKSILFIGFFHMCILLFTLGVCLIKEFLPFFVNLIKFILKK
ncbi:unnamed protein product [Paramecium sonneborni]|uniref:EGF-like domain-containing protein n=1 Tax=Paramecium sonneborni TaxID=65129 RepID=A0A8S1QZS9_9CILI|nr:unnamed protein product [Paramecium sonneborni]